MDGNNYEKKIKLKLDFSSTSFISFIELKLTSNRGIFDTVSHRFHFVSHCKKTDSWAEEESIENRSCEESTQNR
jgi:hypothetical protein